MAKIAINGFGRIGRLFFRYIFDRYPDLDVVAINDLGDIDNLAYLLKFDSVYRTYERQVKCDKEKGILKVDNKEIKVFQEKDPAKLPWGVLEIDIAVEATGAFESFEKSRAHLNAGAKRVVITAPAKDEDGEEQKTVLLGVNEDEFKKCKITSNGSCTTNAASPVAAIMAENPGVFKGILSSTHAYTATQNIVDGPTKGKDYRRGRAGAVNISPSFTGAAIAVTRAVKELKGKFDGIAIRVPIVSGSLADFTFISKRKTTKEEINEIFKKAAEDPRWKGILKVSEEQLVSSDIIGDPYAAIVDLTYTKVVDGDLIKVLAWYDNEWGYIVNLAEHVARLAKTIK
jgi:glyceraldehyde 3-phosphate dehydrogenase